jgi:hypothetical protein
LHRFGKEALMALIIEDKVKNEVLVKTYGKKHAPKNTCPGMFSLLTFSPEWEVVAKNFKVYNIH